ncbi:hypothetical protein [Massilia phyllosphaerae]|uniref:hypothetical protein n=1 Tax=Massilia phyllosphaerae TaxID=3106034 RepID=UPI002B1CCD23|nr:hypothetical protein [Massilia sp. SGZ-792]
MIERGPDRRSGVSSHFTCPHNNRRRPAYERRGTVPAAPPVTREQQLFGERRQNKR